MQGGRESWAQTWGQGGAGAHRLGCVSDVWWGKQPPLVPPAIPQPPPLLQALGQLRLGADGAGPAVQAVIVTGQAARCYLPIRAAVGHTGSVPWVPPAALCPLPGCSVLPPAPQDSCHPHRMSFGETKTPPPPPPAPLDLNSLNYQPSCGPSWFSLGVSVPTTPSPPSSSTFPAPTCRRPPRSAC